MCEPVQSPLFDPWNKNKFKKKIFFYKVNLDTFSLSDSFFQSLHLKIMFVLLSYQNISGFCLLLLEFLSPYSLKDAQESQHAQCSRLTKFYPMSL